MLEWVLGAVFAVLSVVAAYFDVRHRTIPNWLNGSIAVLGIVSVGLLDGMDGIPWSLAHLAAALAVGLVFYALKLWGGGDAKFYAASAAWFSLREFPGLIISISLAGMVLLIGWFLKARFFKRESASGLKGQLPYGVAIAAGGLLTMAARTFDFAG